MELTERRSGDAIVLAVDGRVDIRTAPEFEKRLIPLLETAADTHAPIVIDFSKCDYVSSAGLRVIMIASKQARMKQTPIAVAALQPTVREVYRIARFEAVMPCHNDVETAVAALTTKS